MAKPQYVICYLKKKKTQYFWTESDNNLFLSILFGKISIKYGNKRDKKILNDVIVSKMHKNRKLPKMTKNTFYAD